MRASILAGLAVMAAGVAAGAGAAGAQEQDPAPYTVNLHGTPGCPVCRLWDEHRDSLLLALHEAAPLPDGVILFFYSDNFRVIEDIQRFAYERQALEASGAARAHTKLSRVDPEELDLEITTSPHGVFAIITSENPSGAAALRGQTSASVRMRRIVEF
jgi:hypothetical protein